MISDVIRTALAKGKKKQTDIADVYKCKPAVIYSKMQRSSWSAADLARIADIVGAQLVFVFPDKEMLRIVEDHPVPKKKTVVKKQSKETTLQKKARNKGKKKTDNAQYEQTMLDLTL